MKSSKKFTRIRAFGDNDVVQHILLGDGIEFRAGPKTRKKPELEYKLDKRKSHYDDDDEEVEDNSRAMSAMAEEHDPDSLYGSDVFKFRTPKKSGQMALKAQVTSSPKTPIMKNSNNDGSRPAKGKVETPVKQSRSRVSKSGPLTPIPQRLAGPAQREHLKVEQSTPYRLRKRHVTSAADGGSDSDDSMDDSSDEDDDNDGMDVKKEGKGKSRDSDLVASAEAYFDIHSMNQVTSDRTLANLDTPRMDIQTIRQVLKGVRPNHVKETSSLVESHKVLFDKWMLNMCQDYNILTYGLGSKLSLLESFRQSHLKQFSHLVVNGYFPSLTIKHILTSITEEILEESKSFTNIFAHVEFIDEYFKSHDEDFYLVIHNIDGVLLRSQKCQNILSLLAAIPSVHIISSVDHINASFLWDEIQFFRFRWLWYDTTTFLPYEAENSYENSLMVQQSGGLALSSLVHVMRSLTPNAKRIFLTLAEFQLNASANTNYEGMSFQALYQKCREDFLVNSDLTLQAQLVEFKDHRLIRVKKNYEGIEHLIIPIDNATLKLFLKEQKENKS